MNNHATNMQLRDSTLPVGYGAAMAGGSIASMSQSIQDVKRVPEASEQLQRLDRLLSHVEASLAELVTRLDGRVLRPEEPMKEAGCSPSQPQLTQLGAEIAGYVQRVTWLNTRVQDVLNRLEV